MAQDKLRVAIIGSGMIALTAHLPSWKALSRDVELVATADILPERARLLAESAGIPKHYGDWQKMLDEVKPDLVSVCTPNAYHAEQTIAALQAGAHVLCEKPISICYKDAARMYEAAEAAGTILMVGQSTRFTSVPFAAKKLIDEGRLGEIYFGETYWLRRRGIPTWGQFHMKEHSGAGPLYDLGVHNLDLLFWLMGNPAVKTATGVTYTKFGNRDEGLATSLADSGAPEGVITPRPYDYREFDVEDLAAGFFRMEGGISVSFKTSWAANVPGNPHQTTVLGTEGGIQIDPFTFVTNVDGYQTNVTPIAPGDPPVAFPGHIGETAHLVRVIKGEEELIVKKEQVLNVMKALDGLHESARTGREVVID
jgi:predicted dehydrogenase